MIPKDNELLNSAVKYYPENNDNSIGTRHNLPSNKVLNGK